MRRLKQWCQVVGLWLARLGGYVPPKAPAQRQGVDSALTELAVKLVTRQNVNWPERDGECKRGHVYAELTNIFPQTSKRVISQAIEDAVCGVS